MSDNLLYKKILDYLIDLIQQNGDVSNYKLPSERSLALKFNSSRRPVRSAYDLLIEKGYVESIYGKGYFIKEGFSTLDASANNLKGNVRVLFITPNIKTAFMNNISNGITDFCDSHNLDLSIEMTDDKPSKEKSCISKVKGNYKGMILFPIDYNKYNEELIKLSLAKYPISIIDRTVKNMNASCVTTDNYEAMCDAVKFLHSKKIKSVVYITPPRTVASTTEDRINGFNHGLFKYYGFAKAENMLKVQGDRNQIKETIKKYLIKYPDKEVLIISGVHASCAIKACQELGISIPEKIKLMIFDNELTETENMIFNPYVIEQDGYKIGYYSAEAIYNQIYGDSRIQTKVLPVKIY